MSVQLFVPKFRVDECLEEIRECLEKGWTGLGYKTVAFEEAWKHYTGLPHAHFLSSNTVGLHLALLILKQRHGWADGDEVISTALTFVSTNHVILQAGLTPVFADVDVSLCLSPESVARHITAKTKAIIFVGMGGNIGALSAVIALCRERGIAVILDAAHMAGTRVEGDHVGRGVDVAVFSFQAVKNLPTADSGMICFADAANDERARKMSWLGINKDTYARTAAQGAYKWKYDVEDVGFKYHGNSIMAAIGLVQLRYLDQDNAYRRQLATWYQQSLANAAVNVVAHSPHCESARHLFQIRTGSRDALMLALNEHDVYPGVHYATNTAYSMYRHMAGNCPEAIRASDELISLPLHLGLTRDDVTHVSELVTRYAK